MKQNLNEVDPEEFLQELREKIPGKELLAELKQPSMLKLAGITTVATIFVYFVGGWLISLWSPGPTITQTNNVEIYDVLKKLEFYKHQTGTYPDGEPGVDPLEIWNPLLSESETSGGIKVPALLEEIPRDTWGNVLRYEFPNTKIAGSDRPAIWSCGPDGVNDNGDNDDLSNWR